jgi:hypothetical protein
MSPNFGVLHVRFRTDRDRQTHLTGLCCASARLGMQTGLEEVLRAAIRDFGDLQLVFETIGPEAHAMHRLKSTGLL